MGDKGYALNLLSPIRHVATEMDRAAPAALSVEGMAETYQAIPGDLARVKLHEHCTTDDEATIWLIRAAIAALRQRGKSGRVQIVGDAKSGYRFAGGITFEDLRYDRKPLHRAYEEDEEDKRQALRAVYNDLNAERAFSVTIAGARGAAKEQRLHLHPLAHAIPQVTWKEFEEFAGDIKRHGVRNPITIFDGRVLDGRHRLAVASALKLPLRVVEFEGDQIAARDEVISQNVQRRHLTMAQRGLIVREFFLPDAKEQAKEQQREHGGTAPNTPRTNALSVPESAKAAEIAALQANGLATARTIETMAPVDDAPKTKERIRSGEIKSAAEARREALKETGSPEPENMAALQPLSAFANLGHAAYKIRSACDAIQRGNRGPEGVTEEKLIGRINEVRALLDRAEELLTATG